MNTQDENRDISNPQPITRSPNHRPFPRDGTQAYSHPRPNLFLLKKQRTPLKVNHVVARSVLCDEAIPTLLEIASSGRAHRTSVRRKCPPRNDINKPYAKNFTPKNLGLTCCR